MGHRRLLRPSWAVVEKASDELAGLCGIFPSELVGPGIEIAYIFGRRYWGRGYPMEAARACLALGFEEYGFDRILAVIMPENTASIHVADKLGMRFDGVARHYDCDMAPLRRVQSRAMSLGPSKRLVWPGRPNRQRSAAERQRIPRARAIERLAGLIAAIDRPHPVCVAIDGVSAAGKTMLADELGRAVERQGRPAIRASIDYFHRPAAERYRRGRYSPQGYYLDTFDYPVLRAALLLPLGPGGNGR